MKNNIYLLFFMAFLALQGQAPQETRLPQVVPPSPTVANLMAFEEVPINYYTGQPNITLPLFSKALGDGLSVNIALQYHTSGTKIDNISGWTGTGWSLVAGGSISRTVRGVPDEIQKGPGIRTGVLHNSDFWDYDNLTWDEKDEFNWNVIGTPYDIFDSQLDLYQFNFMGISGRFIIVKENNVLVAKLLTQDQNIKIDITYDAAYAISSFELTDALGHRYLFNTVESTESQPVTGFAPQGTGGGTIPASGATNVIVSNSSWHLSHIRTSNGDNLATFSYQNSLEQYTASITRTYNRLVNTPSNINDMLQNAYNISIMEPRQIVSYLTTTSFTKKLSTIAFADGSSIDFSIGGIHPETNGARLQNVILKHTNGSENKRYTLEYETTDRLWLHRVKEIAGGTTLTYDLGYYEKENLPPFDSVSDDWGFMDGAADYSNNCAQNLSFDGDAIKTGLLTSITYPNGGSKEFEYEHNTFSYEGSTLLSSEDFFTYNPSNTTVTGNASQHTINSTGGIQTSSPTSFTLGSAQEVQLSTAVLGSDTASNSDVANSQVFISNNTDFEISLSLEELTTSCYPVSLAAGTYDIWLQTINLNVGHTYTLARSLQVNHRDAVVNFREEAIGGGPRIKTIRFNDLNTPLSAERTIDYAYHDPQLPNRSSGSADAKLGSLSRKYSILVSRFLFGTQGNVAGAFFGRSLRYDVDIKGHTAQLTQGGYIGYKHVTVSESGNGKKVYSYTSPQDFPSPPGVFRYPYPPVPQLDYKRGLMLEQAVYNEAGNILTQQENTQYNYSNEIAARSHQVYDPKVCAWKQFYHTYQQYVNNSPAVGTVPMCGQFTPCITLFNDCGSGVHYALKDNVTLGWAQLEETLSKNYFYDDQGGQQLVQERQSFAYNTSNFQQNVVDRYFDRNGTEEHLRTEIFYPVGNTLPGDYGGSSTSVTDLAGLNMINIPLYTRISRNGTIQQVQQQRFKAFNSGRMDLEHLVTQKGSGSPIEERITYEAYDQRGNVLQVAQVNGPPISYIWGYHKTLPVAKVENATRAEIEALSGFGNDFHAGAGPLSSTQENTLRNGLPNALITTFVHDPLVGILEMTDPRGYTMFYEYDAFNRLKAVRNAANQLITEHEYHYKQQN